MKQRQLSTKKGFTIIEVVLVLAIAGLIFLMVFLALPALQRNQRDTQRKNDLSRVQSAINSFQSNNRGTTPADVIAMNGAFKTQYLLTGSDTFQDPDGDTYTFVTGTIGTLPASMKPSGGGSTSIYFFKNARCVGENTENAGGSNKVAIALKLEGGGVYCLNN